MSRYLLLLLTLAQAPGQIPRAVSKAQFEQWMSELSNWGRWGKDDELGAINLITPAKRKAAAAQVREGVSVSLSHDAEKQTAPDNPSPFCVLLNNYNHWLYILEM